MRNKTSPDDILYQWEFGKLKIQFGERSATMSFVPDIEYLMENNDELFRGLRCQNRKVPCEGE